MYAKVSLLASLSFKGGNFAKKMKDRIRERRHAKSELVELKLARTHYLHFRTPLPSNCGRKFESNIQQAKPGRSGETFKGRE